MFARNNVYRVGKFPQLTRTVYGKNEGLLGEKINALCFDKKSVLYVGTDKGLYKLNDGKFNAVDLGKKASSVSMLSLNEKDILVGAGKVLYTYNGKKVVDKKEFSSELVSVKTDEDNVMWVLTKTVLYRFPAGSDEFDMKIGVPGEGSCLAVKKNNKVYIGTNGSGLHALSGKRWHWCELTAETTGLLSNVVTTVDIDPVGDVWVGTDKGVCVYDDKNYWLNGDTISSLPKAHVTDMAVRENGDRYYATTTGMIHQHNGKLSYYGYKRWLPSMNATAVVIAENGDVCVATDAGLSVFKTTMMTLEEKGNELRKNTEKYNIRKDGYVLIRTLDHEGVVSLDEGFIDNSDNDGVWTSLYTASLCFQYACTKDKEVKKDAARGIKALFKLSEVTGIKGFAARAIRYPDERNYGTGARQEWHITKDKDGNTLEWLGETSSDEMVGHFYAYTNYFDLVADAKEKKEIKDKVAEILNHIIEHNFRLVDADGLPTTWANWNPDILNNDQKWMYEQGTNSLEFLTFLKIGYHITGDDKYEELFMKFAGDKHYVMNLMRYRIPDNHLLHIDDSHDFLMISILMRYTEDPKLRGIFAMGLQNHWNEERVERCAFFNFVYGALTGEEFDVENCIDELQDYPMDHVAWTLYNSYRPDLEWDLRPAELGMIPQLMSPLSAHERRICNNDENRFIADSGIKGRAEELFKKSDDPTAFTMFPATGNDNGTLYATCTNFLHAYWYARYHGLIEEA